MEQNANTRSYYRNREKILEQKRKYYQENKNKIIKKQRGYQNNYEIKKVEELQPKTKKLNEVLDVLRKDKSHYLWGKPVISWNKSDWKEFNKLEECKENI